MKKSYLVAVAIAALACSCVREQEQTLVPDNMLSVMASVEPAPSKTVMNESGQVLWEQNDRITVGTNSDASAAYARDYNDSQTSVTDVLFTNATESTANPHFTANGQIGLWRTLSMDELNYLLNVREVNGYWTSTPSSDESNCAGLLGMDYSSGVEQRVTYRTFGSSVRLVRTAQ